MRRVTVGIIAAAVVVAGAVVIVRSRATRPAEAPVLPAVQAAAEVEAEGRVVPVHGVTLALTSGGTVGEILVAEGDRVQSGALLVRLAEARQAAAGAAQAEANLRRATARLAELRAGARAQEIESARSVLQAAEARLAQLRAGARDEERAQAQLQVEQAESQAAAARQRVAQAETALRLAEDELRRAEQLAAQGAVAAQAVEQARARTQSARADLEASRAALGTAMVQTAAAREHLRLVLAGPRPEELQVAASDVRRARAQLELVTAGPRPETLAAAQADVAAAEAGLRQARAALAQMELRAPIPGIVAFLGPKPGEFVSPGMPLVRLADRGWEVETTDLTELSVVLIRPGDRVQVRLDAIPDLSLTGRVVAIEPFGENRQGDIVYRVRVGLDAQDPRLRWNMTATVTIGRRAQP
jgi:HlyD family secretion protein